MSVLMHCMVASMVEGTGHKYTFWTAIADHWHAITNIYTYCDVTHCIDFKVNVGVLHPVGTARDMLGQVLSIATSGTQTHRGDSL